MGKDFPSLSLIVISCAIHRLSFLILHCQVMCNTTASPCDPTNFLLSSSSLPSASHHLPVVSPDTAIAIAFGVLSTFISLVGVLVGYLTFRNKAFNNGTLDQFQLSPAIGLMKSWMLGPSAAHTEYTHIHRHEHMHVHTLRFNTGGVKEKPLPSAGAAPSRELV